MTSPGRRPSTTKAQLSDIAIDLFSERGFERTSVDDIAAAAGIARRTLFSYYPSKNAIAWGEFDERVAEMREHLAAAPLDQPLADAILQVLIEFNHIDPGHVPHHRRRMKLLLGVPALQAHSMLMYAEWRHAIAEFVATRTGDRPDAHLPQTAGWLVLGVALAAYEQWLAHDDADLAELLTAGMRTLVNPSPITGVHPVGGKFATGYDRE